MVQGVAVGVVTPLEEVIGGVSWSHVGVTLLEYQVEAKQHHLGPTDLHPACTRQEEISVQGGNGGLPGVSFSNESESSPGLSKHMIRKYIARAFLCYQTCSQQTPYDLPSSLSKLFTFCGQ
jgi:hypothetical protein